MEHTNNLSSSRLITVDEENEDDDSSGFCSNKFCWYVPPQKSLSVAFCNETSIHGFKFLGQEKRHLTERVFWAIGFLSSLSLAIYLIYEVWDRYERVPVIVSFQSNEQDMDTLPFPAVTICNMNKFPKSKVEKIQQIARNPNHPGHKNATKELVFIRNACNAQQSFAKDFNFAHHRGTNMVKKGSKPKNSYYNQHKPEQGPLLTSNDTELTEEDQVLMTDFLIRNTIQCDELIRLCMLGETIRNCSEIFKPIITDYGKCCTFNILPLPLLLRNPENPKDPYSNPVLGSDARENWPEDLVANWSKWNYEDGFVLSRNTEYPWRQKRSGLPYGLSMLLDPNIDDYYCPASDSLGLRYIMHTPLEMPHVTEFSSIVDLEKEILIEVHPDVTNADDDIRRIEPKKRLCLFGREKSLKFFGPYTGGNCIDECTVHVLERDCNCTLFYMPRDDNIRICDSDKMSNDYDCVENAMKELLAHLQDECGDCETLCEDIAYNYETTIADLQESSKLWSDPNPEREGGIPKWANHKMAVVHIFFGADSTVPKFRKRLYGTTDLIANTGGILGLCLGFSILSGVEVLYFFTLRAFWKFCRKRAIKKKTKQLEETKTNSYLRQLLFQKKSSKVVNVNPNTIPIYARELVGKSMWSPNAGMNVHQMTTLGNSWGKSTNNQRFYGSNTFVPINNKGMRFYTYDY